MRHIRLGVGPDCFSERQGASRPFLQANQVYQILAGYPDGNDAQLLRNDPLFKSIVGKDPRCEDEPLASGSTINRFLHAFTRREAEKPLEERDAGVAKALPLAAGPGVPVSRPARTTTADKRGAQCRRACS